MQRAIAAEDQDGLVAGKVAATKGLGEFHTGQPEGHEIAVGDPQARHSGSAHAHQATGFLAWLRSFSREKNPNFSEDKFFRSLFRPCLRNRLCNPNNCRADKVYEL
jgi:hypothetical protein